MQSAQSTVYLTGIWLDRTVDVSVSGVSLNFSVWLNTVDSAMSVVSSAAALSIAAEIVDATGQQQRRHRFHVLQSSHTVHSCTGTQCVANITLQGRDNSVLTFTAPVFNLTGYLPLVITYNNSADSASSTVHNSSYSALTTWTGRDWMYYTPVECDSGMIVGLYCESCPTGGYCPGGGRVWPLPGYWSFSETSLPVACTLPQACPGALSSPLLNADGTRMTEVCADGYTGRYCVDCAAGYYSNLQRCLSCGLESAELMELVALLIIAFALFLSLSVAVAVASANRLSTAVSAVLVVQHLSVVGKLAGQQIPSSLTWLVQTFSIISMLNFDIQFVKPGCVVSVLSFLTVYWCTIGLVCGASLLFVCASAVRALVSRRRSAAAADAAAVRTELVRRLSVQAEAHGMSPTQARRRSEMVVAAATSPQPAASTMSNGNGDWRWRFKARIIHSHLILGSILYLRLTAMNFQAINCTTVVQSDGSTQSVLQIDLTTKCYEGNHLYSAPAIWLLLLVYSIGFPLLCFWLLYRNFHGAVLRAVTPVLFNAASAEKDGSRAGSADGTVFSRGAGSREGEVEMSKLRSLKGAMPDSPKYVPPRLLLSHQSEPQSPQYTNLPSPVSNATMPSTGSRLLLTRRGLLSSSSSTETVNSSGSQGEDGQTVLAYDALFSPSTGVRSLQEVSQDQLDGSGATSRTQACRSPPQRYSSRNCTLSRADSSRQVVPVTSRRPQFEIELPTIKSIQAAPFSFSTARKVDDEPNTTRKEQLEAAKLALRQLGKDMRRQEMLGYMYRQLKGELYYFRLLFFVTSFGFAAVSVLPSDPTLRLFLTGVFLALDLFTTCSLTPFESWWRNVLSSLVSLFGVVQIFVMLALVQLGISSGDGSSVDLGHSKAAQQQTAVPSSSLTGASDKAARYELYFGILLVVDGAAIAYVHRRRIVRAVRWLRDTLTPPARRLCELCAAAAVAVWDGCVELGRLLHTSCQQTGEWLTRLTAVTALPRGWMWRRSQSSASGWRDTSIVDSVSFRAVGDDTVGVAMTINRLAEQMREQDEAREMVSSNGSGDEQPMDDEFELEQEWQRLAQYTELLSPRGSEQQLPEKMRQQQQLVLQAGEWPVVQQVDSETKEKEPPLAATGQPTAETVMPRLALSGLTGPLSPTSPTSSTSDAAMRNSLRYIINPWRQPSPHSRTAGLRVDTSLPAKSTRSVLVSPYSAPTQLPLTSRSPRRQPQVTSPSSSQRLVEGPSTPKQQSVTSSPARSPRPVPHIAHSPRQQIELASSPLIEMSTPSEPSAASLSPTSAASPPPTTLAVPLTAPPQPQQPQPPLLLPHSPHPAPTYSPSQSRVQRPRGRLLRLSEQEKRSPYSSPTLRPRVMSINARPHTPLSIVTHSTATTLPLSLDQQPLAPLHKSPHSRE